VTALAGAIARLIAAALALFLLELLTRPAVKS
jgi:hypothetical protein